MSGVVRDAHASVKDQAVASHAVQRTGAGAISVFTDVRSSRITDRPGLPGLLAGARRGEILVHMRLDWLGRSLDELLASIAIITSSAKAGFSPTQTRRQLGVGRSTTSRATAAGAGRDAQSKGHHV